VKALDVVLRLVALAAIVTGIAFIFWPAALIVGGTLLFIEQMT
jgi:hypothetical protein